jgi:peptide chain release factor subunit 1
MLKSAPATATGSDIKSVIALANSPSLFLSVFLSTDPSRTTTEQVRLRLASMLNDEQRSLSGTPLEEPFKAERDAVESYIRLLRPGAKGLAIVTSTQAQESHALWIPYELDDDVRFGPGAHVLPLMDVIDEFQPVALAMVERDKARVMIIEAGRVVDEAYFEAEIEGKHRAGGGYNTGFRNSPDATTAGGGASSRRQRRILVHVDQHLKAVAQELVSIRRSQPFERLLIAGPTETRTLFKPNLPVELSAILAGEFAVDARATDQQVRDQALSLARDVERSAETALAHEIVTRAEKRQGAVTGLNDTLWAMNRGELHILALATKAGMNGNRCEYCALLLPPETSTCPQCGNAAVKVDLMKEIGAFALGRGVKMEIMHGDAAALLKQFDGMGGLTKAPTPH